MNDKVTVLVNGVPQEIDAKQFTVLCHQGGMELEVPSHVTIDAEATLARFRQLTVEEWSTLLAEPCIKWFLDKVIGPTRSNSSTDVRHVVGMIVLIHEAMAQGKQPFIKYPETYLHPKSQSELAQVLVGISNGISLVQQMEKDLAVQVADRMEK